jgi:hypothetical protein
VCPVIGPREDRFTCYGGDAPAVGSEFVLLDQDGYRGRVQVTRTARAKPDPCDLGTIHDVFFDGAPAVTGSKARRGFVVVAVQGREVDLDRSRLVLETAGLRSPSGRDDEQVWLAIDTGDGERPEALVTASDCSGRVAPPVVTAPGKTGMSYCLDYWVRDGRWRRAGRDVYQSCR